MQSYSVLMSVYIKDNPKWLSLSIDSMLNQTIRPDQFVLVCDGPITKELDSVICDKENNNPDIFTIVRLSQNSGLANALNVGLKACRNELVARMDSDDYSLPMRCEKQLCEFVQNSRLALVGTDTQYFQYEISDVSPIIHKHAYSEEEIMHQLRRSSPFGHPTVMYRKSAVEHCGLYDPKLRRSQDYDLFSKIIYNGYETKNIDCVLLYYRADDNMMIRNKSKESCNARIEIQKRIYQRKQCSLRDVVFVNFAMWISRIVPISVYKKIYSIVKKNK